jgi:hypothetical protein
MLMLTTLSEATLAGVGVDRLVSWNVGATPCDARRRRARRVNVHDFTAAAIRCRPKLPTPQPNTTLTRADAVGHLHDTAHAHDAQRCAQRDVVLAADACMLTDPRAS